MISVFEILYNLHQYEIKMDWNLGESNLLRNYSQLPMSQESKFSPRKFTSRYQEFETKRTKMYSKNWKYDLTIFCDIIVYSEISVFQILRVDSI